MCRDPEEVVTRQDFPRTCRIRKRAEYDRAFRLGRSRHTQHFRVLVAPAPQAESRLGLVVSRRVGRAHQRNRVKRLLREYFRVRRRGWAAPLDVVVIAKPGAALLGGAALARELDAVLAPYRGAPPSCC